MAAKQNALLLDLVKSYPVLYDKNHPKYHDPNKLTLWDDIAVELNVPSAHAIRKWNSFVENYKKYLRYTKRKRELNEPIRLWMWAANMAFIQRHLDLDDTTVTRKRLKISSKNDDTIFVLTDEEFDEDDVESPEEKWLKETIIPCIVSEDPSKEYTIPINDNTNGNKERSHVSYDTAAFTATEHVMLGFAKTIDGLSERRRIETKKKIAEILRKAEMEELVERADSKLAAVANTSKEVIAESDTEIVKTEMSMSDN